MSRAKTGREIRSVAETIPFPTQTAYCNDQIIQIIAWEKNKTKHPNSYPKLSQGLARTLGFMRKVACGLFILGLSFSLIPPTW